MIARKFNLAEKQVIEETVLNDIEAKKSKVEIAKSLGISTSTIARIMKCKELGIKWCTSFSCDYENISLNPCKRTEPLAEETVQEMLKVVIPNYEIHNYHSMEEFAKMFKISTTTIRKYIRLYYKNLSEGKQENYGATSKYAIIKKGFEYTTEEEKTGDNTKMNSTNDLQAELDYTKNTLSSALEVIKEISEIVGITTTENLRDKISDLVHNSKANNTSNNDVPVNTDYQDKCYKDFHSGLAQSFIEGKLGRLISQKKKIEEKIDQIQKLHDCGIDVSVIQQILSEPK